MALVAALLAVSGCEDSPTEPEGSVFVVDVTGERFRILLTDPARIAEARRLLASGEDRVVIGDLARGHGGFNTGYRWHLRSETVEFRDAAIEICDGRPSLVESELDYWLATVKRYCPWGARLVREE